MKTSKADTLSRCHKIPEIRFEDQRLTSFGGIVILQALLTRLGFKQRLRDCFSHLGQGCSFRSHRIFLWLLVHLFLGFRRLRDRDYYHDDPMVKRALGLRHLPDVGTPSCSRWR